MPEVVIGVPRNLKCDKDGSTMLFHDGVYTCPCCKNQILETDYIKIRELTEKDAKTDKTDNANIGL